MSGSRGSLRTIAPSSEGPSVLDFAAPGSKLWRVIPSPWSRVFQRHSSVGDVKRRNSDQAPQIGARSITSESIHDWEGQSQPKSKLAAGVQSRDNLKKMVHSIVR
jgi:hypothetical protein